jgi:hypothetical protein
VIIEPEFLREHKGFKRLSDRYIYETNFSPESERISFNRISGSGISHDNLPCMASRWERLSAIFLNLPSPPWWSGRNLGNKKPPNPSYIPDIARENEKTTLWTCFLSAPGGEQCYRVNRIWEEYVIDFGCVVE